jgi:hypothetical protein
LCLAVAGCAAEPNAWTRPDGQSVNPTQLQLDKTACEGEVEKAAVQGQARSTVGMPLGMDTQDMRIFTGCMASRGYLAAQGN